MGLLNQILQPIFGGLKDPVDDPSFGDEAAAAARADFGDGSWRSAHALLESTARDWARRDFYVRLLTERWEDRPDALDAWASACPHSSLPWLVRGAHGIAWAWQTRGSGYANKVDERAADLFGDRLRNAEKDLFKAISCDKADPTPWAFLVKSARGLASGIQTAHQRLTEACLRQPAHRYAYSQMLQYLSPKWGASTDEIMLDFAHQSAERGGPASGLATLVAEAHIEQWLATLHSDDMSPAVAAGVAREYWLHAATLGDLRTAASQSVESQTYKVIAAQECADRHIFAFCFWHAGDWPAACRQLDQLGERFTPHPWHLDCGEETPLDNYTSIREKCNERAQQNQLGP